jgi:hypothetical protein
MKKFLFLPLLIVTYFSFAQGAKEIIGKPVKVGNILVACGNFPQKMTWDEADKACRSLGEGWRLPTKTELNIIWQKKASISSLCYFGDYDYWSSTQDYKNAWAQKFNEYGWTASISKNAQCVVRAVKSL